MSLSDDKNIIRYQGSSHTFNYISYFKFFMPDGVKREEIENKIILIGLDVKASPDMTSSQKDAFPSPFTRFDAQLMPGVELHANLVSNLINKNSVSYKSDTIKHYIINFKFLNYCFYLFFMEACQYYSFWLRCLHRLAYACLLFLGRWIIYKFFDFHSNFFNNIYIIWWSRVFNRRQAEENDKGSVCSISFT